MALESLGTEFGGRGVELLRVAVGLGKSVDLKRKMWKSVDVEDSDRVEEIDTIFVFVNV